jgi:hypothetical protein
MESGSPFIWRFAEVQDGEREVAPRQPYDDRTQQRWSADEIIFQASNDPGEQTGTIREGGKGLLD